ncbi:MAG: hypothetical protein KF763_15625 [Cyclobacteriaceae bacterium]|nr:hypothetical protein [Cyclobacteriaceae bacterium]
MNQPQQTKPPLINCHTHIFTGDHVPPYLAKTFVPPPLHYLLPLSLIVKFFRFWYKYPNRWRYGARAKRTARLWYKIRMIGARTGIARFFSVVIGSAIALVVLIILIDGFADPRSTNAVVVYVLRIKRWLCDHYLLWIPGSVFGKVMLLVILLLFFKPMANLVFSVMKRVFGIFNAIPGPDSVKLAKRYLNIGRYSFYRSQARIYTKLKDQYPVGTGFIVLPMDMEFMEAGKLNSDYSYHHQMQELLELKQKKQNQDTLFPFVFVDPRRFVAEGTRHFDYEVTTSRVTLKDCFIKTFVEQHQFSGFKIYPALGYYPFDEALLPLWKYAADHGIPILTHCIRGTIFYRGNKKKEWDAHPVFEQVTGKRYEPLQLNEVENKDFCNNFTHPLNYLCLLDETLLRVVISNTKPESAARKLFGFTDLNTPLEHNLTHLKLCFGHFGGDDEWLRFLESDRDNYSSQLAKRPDRGITFLTNENGVERRGKPEQTWKYVDWYSIICSMMLQYKHVYADLSYIIHSPGIQPLLKHTLQNERLREKVLFGTDFYVVRNHKSEKNMLADITYHLTDEELDQIGRTNPRVFLSNALHGPPNI